MGEEGSRLNENFLPFFGRQTGDDTKKSRLWRDAKLTSVVFPVSRDTESFEIETCINNRDP